MSLELQHAIPNANLLYPTAVTDGGSQPRFCDFDDMVIRLVKWHPSPHGLTSTYSELIASRLGQLIEAPVVRGTVVYVEPALLPPEVANWVRQPFHVGFIYSPGHNFSDQDYAGIENSVALPAAAVQLAWLQVGDQEGHNQYLFQLEQVLPDQTTRRMNRFMLIDQAAICNAHDWSTLPLNEPSAAYNLPSIIKSRVTMESVEPVLQRLSSINDDQIQACFAQHPTEWGLDESQVNKVSEFLIERRKHLTDILQCDLEAQL